jgi:phosphoribosyl 1,2-cyclic phosphodiesterase
VKITFLGVRGSTPAPGLEFCEVGGNTSCVAIGHDGEPPRLVLDAGTGLRRLTDLLGGEPFRGTILLSHLHWDHVQGLPFFAAGDRDDAEVRLLLPEQGDAAQVLARSMSPPHFPIGPHELRGRWSFEGLPPGRHRIEGFDVSVEEIAHKGGRTYGIRVEDGTGSLAYLPDHATVGAPAPELAEAALQLARGVDVLVHDAQFVAGEEAVADAYGHALVGDAVALAERAGVGELWLFHHAPARTDDALAAIAAGCRGGPRPVHLATEATELVTSRVATPSRS